MPKTKLANKVQKETKVKEELKDPKKLFPEFLPNRGMWRIKFTGGGRLPKICEGYFTTRGDALSKIELAIKEG